MSPNPTRRSLQSQQAILSAAYDLARELGTAKVTIEGIAARAGVGKQTIYRWWPSKAAVLLDALKAAVGGSIDLTDTGDVAADLRAQMTAVAGLFGTDLGRLYAGLIAEAQSDPDLARSVKETLLAPRVAAVADRLRKGAAEGEIRPDLNVTAAVELLYGALYYRFLLQSGPLDADYVDATLDLALTGLRA
jgi:AcrR family transcriptional regulator